MKEEKEKKTKKSNSSSKTTKKNENIKKESKKISEKKVVDGSNSKNNLKKDDKKKNTSKSKANEKKQKKDLVKKVNENKSKGKKDVKESEKVKLYKKKQLKKKKEKQKFNGKFTFDILDLLIFVVIIAIVSCITTGMILNYQYKKGFKYVDTDLVSDKNVQEFLNTYSEIIDNFYEEVDSEQMMKAAMEGMLNFLKDNYSIYLDKSDSDSFSEMLDGTYEGIGIVISGIRIEDIYKNSPAEKVGMLVGDEIIEINESSVSIENHEDISGLISNTKENVIVVNRDGEHLTFKVKADVVNVPATTSNVIISTDKKKKIGYISLNVFSTLAFEDFQESLMKLENDKNIDSLIIDLRGNTGGYLNVASNISNLFLEKGKVIYSLEHKNEITTYKDETNDKRTYDIVILVNGSTASAAEILTAALHDSYGAKVVGNKTYGKGKVQTMKHFENAIVKYTSAKWLRPNGDCIDGVGIEPDYDVNIVVENGTIYDKQLDKAIELLS